jgi:hypothetical protein
VGSQPDLGRIDLVMFAARFSEIAEMAEGELVPPAAATPASLA